MNDTIFALATAPGRAAIAVLRCSGPGSRIAAEILAGGAPPPRVAAVRTLRDTAGEALDRAVVLWFPGPRSYSGEDCLELHLHGGPAVVDGVCQRLLALGLRPAEPGEFTRRAFANGKLDLTQAEALADLVEAQTRVQARQALAQAGGALARRCQAWREQLIASLALLESQIDFAEEAAATAPTDRLPKAISELADALASAASEEAAGRRVREGYRVAIIGAPNAGKSSLLNRLLGRPAAIVAEVPGTTRDVLEHPLDLRGYRLVIADTAGLREAQEAIEQEGVRRARAWAEAADLRLIVVDRGDERPISEAVRALARPGDFVVLNKADTAPGPTEASALVLAADRGAAPFELVLLHPRSKRDGRWAAFESGLADRVVADCGAGEIPSATRARHGRLLRSAREHLLRALGSLTHPELAAEDIRLAARDLSRLTGAIDVEEVLGEVFSRFCIGK